MQSHSQDLEQIQSRLLKLEKQNRRFKQLGAMLLIVAAALLLMGQSATPAKKVEASEFVLRDKAGKIRGRFFVNEIGTAQLIIQDSQGKPRVTINAGLPPSISKLQSEGSIPAIALYSADGSGSLLTSDAV